MLMTQTGYDYDSAVYYRARYYDPNIGRFISEDPIRFKGGSDFYVYVSNDPINLTDPQGLCKFTNCLKQNWADFAQLGLDGLGFIPATNLMQLALKQGLGAGSSVFGTVTGGNPYSGVASIIGGLTEPAAVGLKASSPLASALTSTLGTGLNAITTGFDLAVAIVDMQQCLAGAQ